MKSLNLNEINKISPYELIKINCKHNNTLYFNFKTDQNLIYKVHLEKLNMFKNTYSIGFSIQEGIRHNLDPKIFLTLLNLLEYLFKQKTLNIIYGCKFEDGLGEARNRLYRIWFKKYFKHDELTLVNSLIKINDDNLYLGLILKNNNPNFKSIVSKFLNAKRLEDIVY